MGEGVRKRVDSAVADAPPHTEVGVTVDPAGSVTVTAHGPGVPFEERGRIFERFWRGKTRSGAGAGLGLAIVDEIMKAHRGTVKVADAPGGGASLTLLFRLATAAASSA